MKSKPNPEAMAITDRIMKTAARDSVAQVARDLTGSRRINWWQAKQRLEAILKIR